LSYFVRTVRSHARRDPPKLGILWAGTHGERSRCSYRSSCGSAQRVARERRYPPPLPDQGLIARSFRWDLDRERRACAYGAGHLERASEPRFDR
jgi:hypothetical protein